MIRIDVEIIRILSAIGIVWFHSGLFVGKEISYSGLICFAIISAYFAMSSSRETSVLERASRLIVPCIFWSIVYAAFKAIQGGEIFPEGIGLLSAVLGTPAVHLWYLPFIFISLISIDRMKCLLSQQNAGILSVTAAITFFILSPQWRDQRYGIPWDQYIHAIPAVLIGVFLSVYSKINKIYRSILLASLLGVIFYCVLIGVKGVGTSYFIGTVVCLVLLRRDGYRIREGAIETLSAATFGVYLIHPLLIFIFRHFGINGIFLPIISAIFSFAFVVVARKMLPISMTKYTF